MERRRCTKSAKRNQKLVTIRKQEAGGRTNRKQEAGYSCRRRKQEAGYSYKCRKQEAGYTYQIRKYEAGYSNQIRKPKAKYSDQRRVRHSLDSSASACCKAGPSSNLGSALQRRPSIPSGSNDEIKSGARRVVYIKYYMYAR